MNGRIVAGIRAAGQNVEIAKDTIRQLDLLHSHVTQYMHIPDNRCFGHVLYADPIGVSSGPDGYTRDWAVVEIRKDVFANDFQGNTISISTSPILLISTMLFILYHTGDNSRSRWPRGLRIPRAWPSLPLRRRPLERDSQPQAARHQRRPSHGGGQEREDYRNGCGLVEVPCSSSKGPSMSSSRLASSPPSPTPMRVGPSRMEATQARSSPSRVATSSPC